MIDYPAILAGDTIRHPAHSKRREGEFDGLRSLPRRVLRQLTGLGILTRWGLPPDLMADALAVRLQRDMTTDDLAEWLRRDVLTAAHVHRCERTRRRQRAIALRNGHPSYYAYRKARAATHGHTVWTLRRLRGWS